ncbi:MAG: hypothetical protein M1834_007332 [Cirrosporium novae-zelandiae]|nr:MAG: hypothetical protein M1834_007332 [Cirrosporium novae-zelandiae]
MTVANTSEAHNGNSGSSSKPHVQFDTQILRINPHDVGNIIHTDPTVPFLSGWTLTPPSPPTPSYKSLNTAAQSLRETSISLAFPTETVYGLAASALSTSAVQNIFDTKNRPADNPLIVHIHSLPQLMDLLKPHGLPKIYSPLIDRFWPGPLTIILPLPSTSPLSPLTTAGLHTFGARMPSSLLSLLLLKLTNVPLAAPSANTSTKPSPTTAGHVYHDLHGKIKYILEDTTSPSCPVGVESTVVDGTCNPPAILRPGGVSLEQIQQVPGWESTVIGYKDKALEQNEVARAPGMKYRHYAPRARVILFSSECPQPQLRDLLPFLLLSSPSSPSLVSAEENIKDTIGIGIIRTHAWTPLISSPSSKIEPSTTANADIPPTIPISSYATDISIESIISLKVHDIWLGPKAASVAHGLFSALRALDDYEASVIFVEGIKEDEGPVAAAVMNRLRKASEREIM